MKNMIKIEVYYKGGTKITIESPSFRKIVKCCKKLDKKGLIDACYIGPFMVSKYHQLLKVFKRKDK